ncbi:hypothetical protein HRbin37_01866 [bacterium HR37]|nr:hypothetical protein HRbin37_01866 [bacterium HR37]
MKLKKEEETLGAFVTSLIDREKTSCPDDEEFSLYIENRLDAQKRQAIILHLVSCRDCRERLTIEIPSFEKTEERAFERAKRLFRYPFISVPVTALILIIVAFALNTYMNPNSGEEERYRGANLVALKQLTLTPELLATLKEDNKSKLKEELLRELPKQARVSDIVVEEQLKELKEVKEGEKIVLILYNNGLLKVKLQK